MILILVATALTVYGIETLHIHRTVHLHHQLQQPLPFTVLKLVSCYHSIADFIFTLQQYLPFTVLKRMIPCIMHEIFFKCCNRTYHSRYWNNFERSTTVLLEVAVLQQHLSFTVLKLVFIEFDIPLFNLSCNNVYHLRYTSQSERQQRNKSTMKYTHCKYLNEVKLKRKWYGNSAYRLRYWNP